MTDTRQYLNDLDAQLARAGIRGARRKRIVAEFADHLSGDRDADLGDPTALATQFADELGTSFARTAAFQAFVALALAGILVVVRAVALLPLTANALGTADTVLFLISAIAAQVALVAGGLGLLRALQLRGRESIPRTGGLGARSAGGHRARRWRGDDRPLPSPPPSPSRSPHPTRCRVHEHETSRGPSPPSLREPLYLAHPPAPHAGQ